MVCDYGIHRRDPGLAMSLFRRDSFRPDHGFGCPACAVGKLALILLGIILGGIAAGLWLILWGPRGAAW